MVNSSSQSGFTYLGALYLVAIFGLLSSGAAIVWDFAQHRAKERELIFVGNQFRSAIQRYYEQSPGRIKRYPGNLSDLILDPRFVDTRRHLRRVYKDPMTGTSDWGIIHAPDGGISGVYSLSSEKPIKKTNFREKDRLLEGAGTYKDWKFVFLPLPSGSPTLP